MVEVTPGEIVALGVVALAAVAVIVHSTRGRRGLRLALVTVLAVATAGATALVRPGLRAEAAPPVERPGPGTALGYVSSAACLGCHPGE
ncbi:MAG: hypothetical protein K0S65_4121, partial [Labilithrix sp.]|nr:hypothetical protein [Labilithrix sp.]